MRGSEWTSLKRCLAIVQRLQQGPATSLELFGYVLSALDEAAYPSSVSAREKAFKRDRENLKKRLGVKIQYSASTKKYTLAESSELFRLKLSVEGLRAISILSNSFEGHVGSYTEIKDLLSDVVPRLSNEDQRNLESMGSHIYLDLLGDVDPNHLSKKVWVAVWKAVKSHRKLAFNYRSPRYEDQNARYQEVVPYRIQYQSGHWYLRAYRLLYKDSVGIHHTASHVKYRLSYLLEDDALTILPQKMPSPPAPPRYFVQYRLLPPLSNGIISQRFDEMQVKKLEDDSVLVSGFCEDVFEAGRILLTYGEYCIVTGGEEMLKWMKNTIEGMAENYLTEKD
jgi:predicted DNA-binding transcriptional regulator YafY